jgi:hypothetical protein
VFNGSLRSAAGDGARRVTPISFLVLLPAWLSLAGFAAAPDAGAGVRLQIVQSEQVLRVPVQPRRSRRIEWVERKGPKCVPIASLRGAALSGPNRVDFILNRKHRVRAELSDDCPALDFYDGFYLLPEDQRICADRDFVHSRIGGSCRIARFRELVPKGRK